MVYLARSALLLVCFLSCGAAWSAAKRMAVFARGTAAHAQVQAMPEEEARWIFQQLLVAIDYCQRLGIANRDIKVGLMHHTALLRASMSVWMNIQRGCMSTAGYVQYACADALSAAS